MAFNGDNMTPLGGNSRAGVAPMGWGYQSSVDSLATVQATGYFDSFNKLLLAGQFIYTSLTDGKGILTISSVDKFLKQVTLDPKVFTPSFGAPANVQPVRFSSDFPTPVAGVITLDENVSYNLFDTINLAGDRLVIPSGSRNRITTTFQGVNNLLYSGGDTLISGDNAVGVVVTQAAIVYIGTGPGEFLNVDGGAFKSAAFLSLFRIFIGNFVFAGTIKNFRLAILETVEFSSTGTLVMENNRQFALNGIIFSGTNPASTASLLIVGGEDVLGQIVNGSWQVGAGKSALFIDPDIGENSRISITQIEVEKESGGFFFQPGLTGDIIDIFNNTNSDTVLSITDNSPNGILVKIEAPHNLEVFQEIELFVDDVSYNIVLSDIISIPNLDEFVLDLPFTGDAVGIYISRSIDMQTMVPHGFIDGQTLLIEESIHYNGGAKIYNAFGTNFNINRIFVAAIPSQSVAVYNTGSLTGSDPRITVSNVQDEKDSNSIFNFGVSENPPLTAISNGVYSDINFTGANPITTATERFTLINPNNGEFRYDGTVDLSIMVSVNIGIVKQTAGSELYNFILAVNDTPAEIEMVPGVISATNSILSTSFSGALVLEPGDTIKPQVKGVGTTTSITVENFSYTG